MELFHASTVWQCSLCGTHQPASFPSAEDLKEHMQLSHDNENDFTDSQLPLLVDKSHRSVPLIIEYCPFCTKSCHEVGDMAAHVAQELLEFALEALPWDSGSPDPSASCQRGNSLSGTSSRVAANDDDLNLSILDDSDLDIDGASESIDSYKTGVKRPLTEWNAILVSRKSQRLHHDISLIMLCFQPVTTVDQAFLVQRYLNDRHATHLVHPSSTAMSSMSMIGSQPEDKTEIQVPPARGISSEDLFGSPHDGSSEPLEQSSHASSPSVPALRDSDVRTLSHYKLVPSDQPLPYMVVSKGLTIKRDRNRGKDVKYPGHHDFQTMDAILRKRDHVSLSLSLLHRFLRRHLCIPFHLHLSD